MTNNSNIPAIRFKGFSDAWEQRKLPEFVSFFNGLTYTPDDVEETGTLVLRSSNVKNGEIVDADNVYVNDKVATSENVQKGDIIVVVRNGSRALIGKHAQIKASMPNTVIGAFMSGMRSEHSSFVNALLDTSAFENEIAKNMGATINQITGYMFSKIEFMIPSGEEQQKIGEYFQSLDHLITLHQRKYEKLHNIKKSMLEKMFPKNGSNVPEIRFKGFTEAWEQRKFGEVGETYTGLSGKSKDDFGHGSGKFITYMNIFSNPVASPNMTESIEIDDSQNKVRFGDVLFTTSSETPDEVGMSSVWLENAENTYLNSFCFGYRPTAEFNPYYLAYMLRSSSMRKKITFLAQGISRYNISKNKMMDIEMPIPSIDEQKQIGEYFANLDRLITLHQRELEKLQNIKKSMLEKMFV